LDSFYYSDVSDAAPGETIPNGEDDEEDFWGDFWEGGECSPP
jgi:hypothetical protein